MRNLINTQFANVVVGTVEVQGVKFQGGIVRALETRMRSLFATGRHALAYWLSAHQPDAKPALAAPTCPAVSDDRLPGLRRPSALWSARSC